LGLNSDRSYVLLELDFSYGPRFLFFLKPIIFMFGLEA